MVFAPPGLTAADKKVLNNLQFHQRPPESQKDPKATVKACHFTDYQTLDDLAALSDPKSDQFEPVVFTGWDVSQAPPWANIWLIQPYIRLVQDVVRKPSDIIYVSHLLMLFTIGLPNFVFLFIRFNWIHAILHWMFVVYFVGPYSIITHHHVHGRGILSPNWAWLDIGFPYVLGPMMGQTWNSFYYHHKHHHIEDNGPDDLSGTIRYQRDSALDLCLYLGRFVFLIWFELPLYYIRKGRSLLGIKYFAWEMASYGFIILMAQYNFKAAMMALVIPLLQWRIAVMTNNWSQHVFVDDEEPTSNFRSSITLIDVVANRHGLNDGYHTSHHLSPLRHWREHPFAFIKSKDKYASQAALTFQNLDFIKLAILVCRKEYNYLAECLVPMGDQIGKTNDELAAMLRRKTRKFSKEQIVQKYRNTPA